MKSLPTDHRGDRQADHHQQRVKNAFKKFDGVPFLDGVPLSFDESAPVSGKVYTHSLGRTPVGFWEIDRTAGAASSMLIRTDWDEKTITFTLYGGKLTAVLWIF